LVGYRPYAGLCLVPSPGLSDLMQLVYMGMVRW